MGQQAENRAWRVLPLIFLLTFSTGPATAGAVARDDSLRELLAKAAATCRRREAASLDFVCREEIEERIFYNRLEKAFRQTRDPEQVLPRFYRSNSLLYDYQLKRFGEGRSETRTLLRENGRQASEEQADLKTKTFRHRFVVFGPTGLIGEAAQERYIYRRLGDESIEGEVCAVLEATPRPGLSVERLDGKVWISPRDGGIRRIQWRPESVGNFESILRVAEQLRAEPRLTFVSEYGREFRGLRFPSLVSVKEQYLVPFQGLLLFSEIEVKYTGYKFFTVETEVAVEK